MHWKTAAVLALGLAASASACSSGNGPVAATKDPVKELTLFFLADLRGTIEPCGCTTDPYGDMARTAKVIQDARASGRPVLVLDGGSTLYTEPALAPERVAQEQLKADLIVEAYGKTLQVAALGLGPYDLPLGTAGVRLPRQAANVPEQAGVPLEAPRLIDVGGVRVGLFGVVAPDAVASLGATDPVAAAKGAVAKLRADGAQVVVGLLGLPSSDASKLVRAVDGIDFAVLTYDLKDPAETPQRLQQVGKTVVIQPANRGQVLGRVDLTWRGPGPIVDAVGPAAVAARQEQLGREVPKLEEELAGWAKDPSADQAFVARKRDELAAMKAEQDGLKTQPAVRAPDKGSWFTYEAVAIKKQLACDAGLQAQKRAYDKAAGEANAKAAAGKQPPAPPPGQASYVGIEECANCHSDQVAFWEKTRHAQAWETLEEVGKQLDYACTGCHVTGFDKPGGSTMGFNEPLRDVQCEVCHGPGSLHVDAEGPALKKTIARLPAPTLCADTCHTKEHSDTFALEAYLRDITGPGHGADFRKKLGDGPTGHTLRSAGLAKAGSTIGAGCTR